MNSKQKTVRAKKIFTKNIELRDELWPKINSDSLWNRKRNNGFTTLPRPMPHILQIIDSLADKGKPVSQVYLNLWCRVFDESLVEVKNEKEMAFEARFTGQRAVATWKSRMSKLVDMGFIEVKPGSLGKYTYVLILNPYLIIKKLKHKISEELYNALFGRAQDVGEKDLKTGN
jgi:hypothetical protein